MSDEEIQVTETHDQAGLANSQAEASSKVLAKPANPHAYVLSQAAFQLYTSAAHSKEDVAERLELLEKYLVKVSSVEGEE